MTRKQQFTVTALPWGAYWELRIEGVGVTQSEATATDAEATARDFIAEERDVLPGSFEVVLDLREVAA